MEHDKPTDPRVDTPWPPLEEIVSGISGWMLPARWHLGETGTLEVRGCVEISRTPRVLWLVISDGRAEYNVPLVLDHVPDREAQPLARVGAWHIHDAAEHPAGQRALLALLAADSPAREVGEAATAGADLPMGTARMLGRAAHGPLPSVSSARKLTSEQSNTSIVYRFANHPPVILKVFRVLAPGHNPDVELQQSLDNTGTVPRQYGSARMNWTEGEKEAGADVVVAAEFLEGARDAWQVISDQVKNTDGTLGAMAESIRALGALTRTMHDELAKSFPTVEATAGRRTALRHAWSARAHAAMEQVPDLEAYEGLIETAYSATEHVRWPELQRIHGDYHLGQVLEAPGRGWCALDFEGEPLRPLAERTSEDLALRDLAGMLRSFDYAAGAAGLAGGDNGLLTAWAEAAKESFLSGYGELSDEELILLEALVLDKALYEVVYEAMERPSWLAIPVAGVTRIVSAG